jgi:hypothetical protein
VRLYRANAPTSPIVERVVKEPRCSLEPGVLAEGSYLWSALPLDGEGRERGGGRLNKLDLLYDNARSTLTIDEVASGSVSGVAPLGSRLFVNGRAAPLDGKGRFSLELPGKPRVVIFKVVARDGGESYWVRSADPRRGR